MSGGVDSSVAAALMRDEGHDVFGVTLQLWPKEMALKDFDRHHGCCSLDAVEGARRVANRLGLLLRKALALGADLLATGHYARIDRGPGGYQLRRAADERKDQSYVLYQLGQEELAVLRFPIGDWAKAEVREKAGALGLVTALKPESQEICFVADGSYRSLLKDRSRDLVQPGPIVDQDGTVIGHHDGIAMYTVGQRSGLRLEGRGAPAPPPHLRTLDAASNTVTIGGPEQLLRSSCRLEDVRYVAGQVPRAAFRASVKVRSHAPFAEALVTPLGEQARVDFDDPQDRESTSL